jgi:hypothetical protein
VDFAIVTALIFFLWLAAKKTKKLLRRLEPDEKIAQREMIVVKASLNGVQNTHLINSEEEGAAEPEPAVAEEPGMAFEIEQPEMEAAAAASEPGEFSWEPAEAVEVGAR